MKRKILALLFIIAASSAFAIPKAPCDKKDVCCEDPAPGPFGFAYPRDIGLECPMNFYIYGDFLWMKGSEEGLDYALVNTNSNTSWAFPLVKGEVQGFSSGSKEWDWRPGFRIGLGYYGIHDDWSFDIEWTYIKIKADASTNLTGIGGIVPLMLPPLQTLNTFTAKDASARWTGDYNTADLSFGKPYHISRYFVAKPFFGARAAFIDQDYTARYSILPTGNLPQNIKVKHKNDSWGGGLRAGCYGEFLVSSNWYIFGKASGSILFGKFDLSQNANWQSIETSPSARNLKVNDSHYQAQPNAELGLGISWNHLFSKNKNMFSLRGSYEFIHWWNQNQIRRFYNTTNPGSSDQTSRGDLSFNGFQIEIRFEI